MTADPTHDCDLCSKAARMWQQIADDIAAGVDNRYCLTHNTRGWCGICADLIDQAADRYDPDAERVTSRRPA